MFKSAVISFLTILLSISYANSFESIWEKQYHSGQINRILFSPDESLIYSAGADKKLIITNSNTGEKVEEYSFNYNVYDLTLTNLANSVLVSLKHSLNSSVILFNIDSKTSEVILDLRKLFDTNMSVQNQEFIEVHAIQPDKEHILTGVGIYYYQNANHYYRGRLDLWDMNTGQWVKQIYSGGMVNNLVKSPDGKTICFSTVERTSEYTAPWVYKEFEETKLIVATPDFEEFKILRQEYDENMEFADTEVLNELAFSYDSKLLAVATDSHHYFIYDIEKGIKTDSIYSCDCYYDLAIDFIYDNEHIITGSNNGKVLIWNLEYNLARDSKTYPGNPLITSIDASAYKNRYVVADVKGNMSMLASWEISGAEVDSKEEEYSLWGNNENIQIYFKDYSWFYNVYCYDIFGREMNLNYEYYGNLIKSDISKLPSGIYFIRIFNSGRVFTEKILKMN
jgi:WD40 repeat protein